MYLTLIKEKDVNGGAMRDRTADLFAASEALSQLSYSPEIFGLFNNWPNSY